MLGVVIFILILSFLVFIHELGHFLAAKWAGVTVHEFGIGYPPKAIKLFTWKGTVFTLNWIPFGGFVRMDGEEEYQEDSPKASATEQSASETKKSRGQFFNATLGQKMTIILAGVTANFLFGIVAFALVFTRMGIPEPLTEARVGEIAGQSPAAEAGIPAGVTITSMENLEGEKLTTPDAASVIEFANRHRGETVTLYTTGQCEVLVCEDVQQQFAVYVRTTEETPQGEGAIGIGFQPVIFVHYPSWEMPARGAWFGLQQALLLGYLIVQALGSIFTQLFTQGVVPQEIAGPVGIVHQAQESGILADGLPAILSFSGMLSINLAIMNLLPLLPLDGGRAVMILLGKVLHRRYLQKLEYYGNYSGFILLISLLLLVTLRDVARVIGA
jgi:regulator of sigma E protease